MKKTVELPVLQISKLKNVHINLDMSGKHYLECATFDGNCPEQLMLSILSDLIDENVDELTKQEAVYLFTIVKIANLGAKLPITVTCPHCHNKQKDNLNLADVTIKQPSKQWKPKTIKWVVNDVKSEYTVLPPSLSLEIKLLDWLSVYRNISRREVFEDNKQLVTYTMYKNLLHLVDSNGNRLINDVDGFEQMDSILESNSYDSVSVLYGLCNEVDSFGITPNITQTVCTNKECGGKFAFHYPILYGLCPDGESR